MPGKIFTPAGRPALATFLLLFAQNMDTQTWIPKPVSEIISENRSGARMLRVHRCDMAYMAMHGRARAGHYIG